MKIFVNGSFDVLHRGHLGLLKYAKALGTYLYVAIDSDDRIRKMKGEDRPFNNQSTRFELMQCLKPVNEVAVFNSDCELVDLIKNYQPDIMVVGSDWKNKKVIGSEHSKSVIFYERFCDDSTTKTIESYIDRRSLRR